MNQKKSVFSLLGGIFLMCSGFFMLVTTASNMIRSVRAATSIGNILALNIDILLLLCGLFILLRRKLPAAIMMCAVVALFLSNVAYNLTAGGASYNWLITGCILGAYTLFAAGLFGRGVYALVMCLCAAALRFVPFVRQLIGFPSLVKYNSGLLLVNNLSSLFGTVLMIAAMVMAGLWLLGLVRQKQAQPPYRG